MKRIKALGICVLVLFSFLSTLVVGVQAKVTATPTPSVTPTPMPTPVPVTSFELFWPIAPGRVMGDSLFPLKSFKETLREVLIFNNLKKAEYNITLSEKRLVEAEHLLVTKKDLGNGKKSLDSSKSKVEKAISLINKSGNAVNVAQVKLKLLTSLENQKALLGYLETQVSEEQKGDLKAQWEYLNSAPTYLQ